MDWLLLLVIFDDHHLHSDAVRGRPPHQFGRRGASYTSYPVLDISINREIVCPEEREAIPIASLKHDLVILHTEKATPA